MEVYRRGDYVQISGGLADREYGHWTKTISPDEEFITPEAIVSVCQHDEEEIYRRLTSSLNKVVNEGPESEQSLPVMFNEYCTTWGNPSHENICEIVNKIKDKGFKYFVIDCGWYKQDGVPWDVSMGDYEVSKELFKDGLDKTVQVIKDAGMSPGIWFEIDNVGEKSKAYNDIDHLLKRDGYPLTTTMRRFWDLRQDYVQKYLREKVIGTLKQYGFEYMKIDCNDNVGIGCDGAESLGEGLRQNQEQSIKFIQKVKKEIPGIILENCASGGHKLEPLMMSLCSMASFSDAHECPEIPIIAANLHRVILPRQSQIWAVIRSEDSLKRVAYSIANTFLGRMCISGDVCLLSNSQWKVIDDGISFYKKIAPIIKDGKTYFYGSKIGSYRHPKGWQAIVRESLDMKEAYVVIHGFNQAKGEKVCLDLSKDYDLADCYSFQTENISFNTGRLEYVIPDDMYAICVYFKKK
jgi:alpha-galactosidase